MTDPIARSRASQSRIAFVTALEALEPRVLFHEVDGSYFDPRLNAIVYPRTHEIVPITYNTHGGATNPALVGKVPQVDPSTVGQWSTPASVGAVAIDAIVLPTGKVLWWDFLNAREMDPSTLAITSNTSPGYEIFCAGHAYLPDGRLFVAGGESNGDDGIEAASIYDSVTHTWTRVTDMYQKRWYPTLTPLSDGDILVTSGRYKLNETEYDVADMPQVWDAQTSTWRDLSTALRKQALYPWMYLAPNGKVFDAGPEQQSEWIDTSGTGAWSQGPLTNYGDRDAGTTVMYRPGKIMIVGGSKFSVLPPTNTAEIIDLNQPNPTWQYTGSMTTGRRHTTATVLADGSVLVAGGTKAMGGNVAYVNNVDMGAYTPEIWNPDTGQWTQMAQMATRRQYHSTFVLLPDARVLAMGGGNPTATGTINGVPDFNHSDAEIFSPPYLFKGARPTISAAPSTIQMGATFQVTSPDAASITKINLVRLSSMTHSFNQEQRFDTLSFTRVGNTLTVTAPASANQMPAGPYMIFLVNGNGVPSMAGMTSLVAVAAPSVTSAQFAYSPNSVSVQFNVNPSNVDASDAFLRPLGGGADVSPITATAVGNVSTYTFAGSIANANYEFHLSAGSVTNINGVQLATEFFQTDSSLFALNGDANHDRHVDAMDQSILTAHLGQSGTFADGDFDRNGTINAADQAILDASAKLWLPAQGDLALPATSGNDAYRLHVESPTLLEVFADADVSATYRVVRNAFASITFTGGAGNDTLTIDYGNGNPIPSGGSSFDGGADSDTLRFLGSTGLDVASFDASSVTFAGRIIARSNTEAIELDGKGGQDAISINAGPSVTITGPQQFAALSIANGASAMVARNGNTLIQTGTLSIGATGALDLNDNDLIAKITIKSIIEGYVITAYHDGDWLGAGGMFSTAAKNGLGNTRFGVLSGAEFNDNNGGQFHGITPLPTDTLVKYTYFGDVDFNGAVDASDYNLIDFGYVNHFSSWSNGDADGNGSIDASDYNLIDFAFATQVDML